MREFGWDDVPETLEGQALEAHLTRRDLLRRASYTAGVAAAAASLPASAILARAARAQAVLPAPADVPIDHFVLLMMENRSFDHYLGWLPGADGNQHETYL